MPLFNKYVPLGDEHKELADRLMELARRANTKVKGVFKFDMSKRTKAANAALTGIGNTRRIVLGDTLINEFSTDEIETVLAHELGHHVHRDVWYALDDTQPLPRFTGVELGDWLFWFYRSG
jgi:STE24 endopeptidase